MNNLILTLTQIQQLFRFNFKQSGVQVHDELALQFNNPGWYNATWESNLYRKAHVNVINALDTHGVWMMHCCIYPHYHNPAPIFGFDVFAGKNKITGCFHDFSPVVESHPLSDWFSDEFANLSWNKKRELPEWATRIFSNSIIAAGNVQSDEEISQILKTVSLSLYTYISSLKDTNNTVDDVSNKHHFYIENQRLNPHNARILMTLGLSEETAEEYITRMLFPH